MQDSLAIACITIENNMGRPRPNIYKKRNNNKKEIIKYKLNFLPRLFLFGHFYFWSRLPMVLTRTKDKSRSDSGKYQ